MKMVMIKFLEWDSFFFSKKIGSLELNSDFQNLNDVNDYDLVYVFSEGNSLLEIKNFETTFIENKIIFAKKNINSCIPIDENIIEANESEDIKHIYDLAFESGKWSRFNLDKNFKTSEFHKLYTTWVDKSFNKEFADALLVYKFQNKSIGFVTYKISDKFATIGLLAVSAEHQGKGIGKKLVHAVEKNLHNAQIDELRIPTQLQNEMACHFYIKLGYEVIRKNTIRHYWKR